MFMAARKPLLRKRSLHVILVVMVFYPLAVYVYAQSVTRATAEDIVLKSIDDGLAYCLNVKAALDELLAGLEGEYTPDLTALQRLSRELEDVGFERRLQRLVFSGGVTESLVRFTHVYDGEVRLLRWGQDPPGRIVGEVTVTYPIDAEAIRDRVLAATSGTESGGICTVTLPLEPGDEHRGKLVVGLASPDISTQLAALSKRLSLGALRMSLIGTSLLALLAAYVVRLNDRTGELELKLEEEKRLAYVGTIAAGMAHEIRNPLSSVKMNIQMIEDRLGEFGEKESDYLVGKVARIRSETERLEESVNNFLAFARPKPLQRRWADLNQAIDHVIEFLEPACLNDGIRIVRDYAADLPKAYIDPDQLGQAIENLMRNAHQAIGRDGIIEVYTRSHGDHLEIRVSDDGPGVPAEAHDKLFDIFFTTKEGGSGLGLTIVKQIAEAHGGSLAFDTIEKRGTTFTISLPAGEGT